MHRKMAEDLEAIIPKTSYRPPILIRTFVDFIIETVNVGPEYGIKVTTVVENYRAGFYSGFLFTLLVGYLVTINFVPFDHLQVIRDVFGTVNLCAYFDYPPSTYIVPLIYVFPMLSMIAYNVASIVRINIAYGEQKISYLARNLLVASHVYILISAYCFLIIFEVAPDREYPITMVFHTLPYANFKIGFVVLQLSVVWFGSNVAWKDIGFSKAGLKLFVTLSWLHVIAMTVTTIVMTTVIFNGIGDMGPGGLVGKGLWWDVHDPPNNIVALTNIFQNAAPLGDFWTAIVIPLLQSMILKFMSFRHVYKAQSVTFYITDNKSKDA